MLCISIVIKSRLGYTTPGDNSMWWHTTVKNKIYKPTYSIDKALLVNTITYAKLYTIDKQIWRALTAETHISFGARLYRTSELGQTSVTGETEIAAQILKLFKMMVKLESAVEKTRNDNRKLQNKKQKLQSENRQFNWVIAELSNRLEKRVSNSERTGEASSIMWDISKEKRRKCVIVPQSSLNTTSRKTNKWWRLFWILIEK